MLETGPSEGGVQNEYPRGHPTIVRPGAAGEGPREVKALLCEGLALCYAIRILKFIRHVTCLPDNHSIDQ